MRLPRIRFTVRGMMIAVAVAGVVSSAVAFKKRRDHFLKRAASHANNAMFYSDSEAKERYGEEEAKRNAETLRAIDGLLPLPAEVEGKAADWQERSIRSREEAARYRDRLVWHLSMKLMYERAARYPWLPVAPDPPEPE